MRRRLAIASVVALAVAAFGLGVLLFIGGPAMSPLAWTVAFAVALLALIGGVITGVFGIILPVFGRVPRASEVAEAAAAGREGLARVLSATPTGARINGAYVYDADLVVNQTRVRDDAPTVAVTTGPARVAQEALVPQDAPPWVS
ncbi:MAG: hypothetical protein AB7K08_09635 [Microbacteriaceae bacterium]